MIETVTTEVRGLALKLVAYTRALKLCARMNYETEVLDFIDQIPSGSVLYDLGACEGRFALYAAMRGLSVWAFEPERRNFDAMLQNMDLNRESIGNRVCPIQKAVGAGSGETTIKIGQPWAGGHHKVLATAPGRTDLNITFVEEQVVETISLDEFVRSGAAPPPDCLKIDVDGSELPVVHGATATLSSPSLREIMFELQKDDGSYSEVTGLVLRSGFASIAEYLVEPGLYNVLFKRRA